MTETTTTAPSPPGAPTFSARRLLYIGTGALGVMFMPSWVHWLRTTYPGLEVRTVLTASATRFVTPTAVAVFAGAAPQVDTWDEAVAPEARHVELAEWADAVVVHPATFHFTSRFALGLADSPTLLALQCTRAPIALAPALPPGGVDSPAWRGHLRSLAERENVVVVPPRRGVSVTTGRDDAAPAALLGEVLPRLQDLHDRLAGSQWEGCVRAG